MSERFRCRSCLANDVDAEHVERCAVRTKAKADAIAYGRGDINIHGAKTNDLWAHIHTRTGDPLLARDITKQVIDLGWRPVVGKYDLWSPPTDPTPDPARAVCRDETTTTAEEATNAHR